MKKVCLCLLALLAVSALWMGQPGYATEQEETPVTCAHQVATWTPGTDSHSGVCSDCGEQVTAAHNYDDGVVTTQPGCDTVGVMTFTCKDCAATFTEELEKTHTYDHGCDPDCNLCDYVRQTDHCLEGTWETDDTHHWQVCPTCDQTVKLEHQYGEGILTKEPGCETAGVMSYTCADCGHVRQEAVAAKGHSYGNWTNVDETYHKHICSVCKYEQKVKHGWDKGVVTRAATCDREGEKTYTCADCNGSKTSEISKLKHTYDHDCDVSCNVCGGIRRTTHKYDTVWSKDDTHHWYECLVCGDDGDYEAHVPGEWIVDVPAGEYTDGTMHRSCTVCDKLLDTETISATGCLHGNEELKNVKEPSCTELGYTGDWTCPRCQAVVTPGEDIPMLEHTTQLQNAKEPTCTELGYTGDMICTECQGNITPGEDIPMLEHTTQLQNAKEPTCTELGYTGDMICTECQGNITPGEDIPMLEHTTQLQNAKEPTCTELGYTGDMICTECQGNITPGEDIPMLPHETQLQNQADADCLTPGYTGDEICIHCQTTVQPGEEIPAKGHRFEEGFCLDCMAEDPDYEGEILPDIGPVNPGREEEGLELSPMIIGCIAAFGLAFVGMVVMIILLIKKK